MKKSEMNNVVGATVARKKDGMNGVVTAINDAGKYEIEFTTGETKPVSVSTLQRHWELVQPKNSKEEPKMAKAPKAVGKARASKAKKEEQEQGNAPEPVVETAAEKKAREKREAEERAAAKEKAKEDRAAEKAKRKVVLDALKEKIMALISGEKDVVRHDDKKFAHFKVGRTGFLDITTLTKCVDFAILDVDGVEDEEGAFGTGIVFKHGPKAWKVGWSTKVTEDTPFEDIEKVVVTALAQARKVEADRVAAADKKAADKKAEQAAKKQAAKEAKEAEKAEKAEAADNAE